MRATLPDHVMTENEQLIDLIANQTRTLLQNHWPDILDFRDGADITLHFSHALSYEGAERTIETTISFARRVKDSVSESIDTAQEELPMKVTINKGKRK
jgi:hypothetical protein